MYWKIQSRSPAFAGVRRGAFSIILAGNQIAESALLVYVLAS
jgi:hypothetical protein